VATQDAGIHGGRHLTARSIKLRRAYDFIVKILSTISACVALFFLAWIIYEVVLRGINALNFDFFTKLPAPPGVPGSGLANAIVGTMLITLMATIMGVPVGLFAGVYLSEFGLDSRPAVIVRFFSNILMGTPSIIIGVFVYTIIVLRTGNFSGYAGAVALAVIMLPVAARTTEDILGLVPNTLRESALALGAPRWKVTLGVVFRAARHGLITGVLLAVARISGETAPLLFTALNNPYWSKSPNGPMANLTVTIFNYAMSPYEDWKQMAWGASLLIMGAVLVLSLFTRAVFRERKL
jgi:phosphate transport system permease protein